MLVKVLILVIILVSNTYIKFMCPEKTGVCVCVCVCACVCKILLLVNMVTSYRNTR